MKSVIVGLLVLGVFASFSNAIICLEGYATVCGKQRDVDACRVFWNPCDLRYHNNWVGPLFDQVNMTMCSPNSVFWAQPCNLGNGVTTPPPTIQNPCDPSVVCTPLATTNICTYQTNAPVGQEVCRTFRTKCDLDKFNCAQTNPTLARYAAAHETRCLGMTPADAPAACK